MTELNKPSTKIQTLNKQDFSVENEKLLHNYPLVSIKHPHYNNFIYSLA